MSEPPPLAAFSRRPTPGYLDETGDRLMTRHVFTPPGQKSSVTLKMVYDRE